MDKVSAIGPYQVHELIKHEHEHEHKHKHKHKRKAWSSLAT